MALVTVSEVLRFALPAGSTLLAGSDGLNRAVTWARQLRARPTTLASVEPGEVWLVSPGSLQQVGGPRAMARLLHDVASAGVAAVVVGDELGPEALAEADATSTPLIRTPADALPGEIEKAIVSLVVDRDRMIGGRVQEVYDRLLATLVEDRGSELLTEIVHGVSGKAVYLLDEHYQPTLQAGGTPASAEAMGLLRRRFWEGQLESAPDRPVSLRGTATGDLSALLRPLILRGAVEGHLALVATRSAFDEFDYRVAERAATVLAIELAKQSAVVEARLRVQGDFLEELLDNPSAPVEQLESRARSLGYDLSRPHVVFVLRPRVPRGAAITARQQQRFVDVTRRRLVLADVATLLRERDGTVQVLVPHPPHLDASSSLAVSAWVDALRSDLETALEPEGVLVAAGVGRTPDPVISYHAALREATQAAEIAASMPGGATTLHFARLGALRLIFHLSGHPELESYYVDLLGPLDEYDRQHRSELAQTLEAFFNAGGNHMQAARDLHVHRNTLIYRLERIRELLGGADLEDPDTRLNLHLALKIGASLGVRTPAVAPAATATDGRV